MSPEIREEKKQTLKILMLELVMPKGFCLKKKILTNFAPQAVSSVENCVLHYLSAYLTAALPPVSLELEQLLSLQRNSILVKDEFVYLFPPLFGK